MKNSKKLYGITSLSVTVALVLSCGGMLFADETEETFDVSESVQYEAAMAATGVAINETNFPDANFRRYVSSCCDLNGDDVLSDSEIAEKSFLYFGAWGINSFDGIQFFTALEEFHFLPYLRVPIVTRILCL